MQSTASFARDGNRVPITRLGLQVSKSITLVTGNSAHYFPLFTLTGSVQVIALYGVVTTTLGSNVTAAHWRLQDQTAQPVISLVTGTTLSNAAVGSNITRSSVVGVALALKDAIAGGVQDPIAATATDVYMPFTVVQKVGSILTEIEFVETTNNGSLGAITFYAGFIPLTCNSNLTVSTTAAY